MRNESRFFSHYQDEGDAIMLVELEALKKDDTTDTMLKVVELLLNWFMVFQYLFL